MAIHTLKREQFVPRPLEEVFEFFSDAQNLEFITPPWLNFQILAKGPIEISVGTLLDYRLKWHGFPIAWRTKIVSWNPPRSFVDVQLRGPYRLWHHTHSFAAVDGGTTMMDTVNYELPFGSLGNIAHGLGVRRDLERVFDYRMKVVGERFAPCQRAPG
ncbi:MAG: SRPBCC family protein [Candidatus Solibacter sp.]